MNIRPLAAALLAAFLFAGCGNDDPVQPPAPPVDSPYQSLTTREAVLNNIEASYDNLNVDRYKALLDAGFVFFLSDGDVNNGLPQQWDRQQEESLTENLFSSTVIPGKPIVKSILMDLQYENGVTWTDIVPMSAPTETWYTTAVFYFFQIKVHYEGYTEDFTYYPDLNSKAQFTVRNAGTESDPQWKLVEMRDLGAGGSLAQLQLTTTEQSTWGGVKSLYR